MAENYSFALEKQRAIERMRELNARAKYRQGAAQKEKPDEKPKSGADFPNPFSGFNIPMLGEINIDSDMALILGIVLILTTEKSDKLLLLALLYILI